MGDTIQKEYIWLVMTVAVVVGMVGYSNCGMHLSEGVKQNPAGQTTRNADATLTETWTQPTETEQVVIPEVVFVVDYSGSIPSVSSAIKTSISEWITQLNEKNVNDLCIGLMRATVIPSQDSGLLISQENNQKCYCTFGTNAVDLSTMVTKFGENYDAALQGASGGGDKEGMIYALNQALTNPMKLQANQTAGCFMDAATLVPILVSDEQDISVAPNNASYTFDQSKYLPEGESFTSTDRSSPFYNKGGSAEEIYRRNYHCKDTNGDFVTNAEGEYVNQIDFETLAAEVADYNGSRPSFGSAIGFFPGNLPDSPISVQPFWGGKEFADSYGPPMVDMRNAIDGNQEAFNDDMNQMALDLATAMAYFRQFDLSQPICDTNLDGAFEDEELVVLLDGAAIGAGDFSVSSSGQKITLANEIEFQPGSVVEVRYRPCLQP